MKLLLAVAAHVSVAAWVVRELRGIRRQIVKLHWVATQPPTVRITEHLRGVQPFDRFDTPELFEEKLRLAQQ